MKRSEFLAQISLDSMNAKPLVHFCEDDLLIKIDSTDILRRQCDITKVLEEISPDFDLFTVVVTDELACIIKGLHNEHARNIVALAQYRQVWKRNVTREGDDVNAIAYVEWEGYKLSGDVRPDKYAIVLNNIEAMPPEPPFAAYARDETNETATDVRNVPLDDFSDPRTILSMSSYGLKDKREFILYWRSITGNTIRTFAPLPPGFPEEEGVVLIHEGEK